MGLRFLIVEGNVVADRDAYRVSFGQTASEAYAAVLREIAPDTHADICFPADSSAVLPDGASLAEYDAVFITGSALNLYDGGPAIERQIALARGIFATRVPFFGSCWGLQVAAAAAGGEVLRNIRGREIGIARDIRPSEAGREHPLLRGRPSAYQALCSHLDIVTIPPGAKILAANAMAPVQAAEIVYEGGKFWGVQYHPEYSFTEVAAIIARRVEALVRERLLPDATAGQALAKNLRAMDAAQPSPTVVDELRLDAEVLVPAHRRRELVNFLDAWVRPEKSARGRA